MEDSSPQEIVKAKYKIIDNALEEADFLKLKALMTSSLVNWKYIEKIQTTQWQSNEGYFLHTIFQIRLLANMTHLPQVILFIIFITILSLDPNM